MRVGTPPSCNSPRSKRRWISGTRSRWPTSAPVAIELTEAFIKGVEAACPSLTLASPRDAQVRGSQVSFRHKEGYAIMQALIARGVIGDFRAPDILRFGFTPLYTTMDDVTGAVAILAEVMEKNLWDQPQYKMRSKVT
jgi:kynureninase